MKIVRVALMLAGLTGCLCGCDNHSPLAMAQSISESDRAHQDTLGTLIGLAAHGSGQATDCGQIARPVKSDEAARCGMYSFSRRKPFFVLYYSYGAFQTHSVASGVAGDADGNVTEISYDSRRLLLLAFPKRSQVSDDGRIVSTPCLTPIELIQTESSELACAIPLSPNASQIQIPVTPLDATICEIVKDPSAFNNKLVRVRGSVLIGSEYSTIDDDACQHGMGLWFALGGGGTNPGLVATIGGVSRPGLEDSAGRIIPPFPVTLVRDAGFKRFDRLIRAAIKADQQAAKLNPDKPVFHQVTATFVGRIDGVSPEIHAFHLKRKPMDKLDYLGFGQAGQFDAQLVVRSVENDAVISVVHDQN